MPTLQDLIGGFAPQPNQETSLADIARWSRLPASGNIEDRRPEARDPLLAGNALQTIFSYPPGTGPMQMESRIGTPLSSQAGFADAVPNARGGQMIAPQDDMFNNLLFRQAAASPGWLRNR